MNRLALLILLGVALGGCRGHGPDADHDHAAEEAGDHGHGHGGGLRYTHYASLTELFVEFPPLVVGHESAFAAHLSRLKDFKAVSDGLLTVILSGNGDEQRVAAEVSDTPGIFRPVLVPERAGSHRLTLRWEGAAGESVHDLGVVEVFADEGPAASAGSPDPTGFAYTKEQQWKIDFASHPVVERELSESVPATITVRARPDAEALLSSPVEGVLRAPRQGWPTVGMPVHRGQLLFNVVPRLGGATDFAALELEVTQRQAEADRARRERTRLQGLADLGAVPEKRLLDARDDERVADAALRAAQARLQGYSGAAAGVAILSPMDGVILRVAADAGSPLSAGQLLVHVGDPSRLWIEAQVAESDAPRLKQPGGALIALGGAEIRSLNVGENARLVGAGGAVNPATRTVPVVFEADASAVRLPIGTVVPGRVYTGTVRRALALPASAVTDDAGVPVVYVQLEGESFERRPVDVAFRDGDWLGIVAGVVAGERVVTLGVPQVRLASTGTAEIGHGHAH